jgi:hypothetical protein
MKKKYYFKTKKRIKILKFLGSSVAIKHNASIFWKKYYKNIKNLLIWSKEKKLKNCQIFFKEFLKCKIKHDLINLN